MNYSYSTSCYLIFKYPHFSLNQDRYNYTLLDYRQLALLLLQSTVQMQKKSFFTSVTLTAFKMRRRLLEACFQITPLPIHNK